MSVWILPDHIADVLPAQARQIEELRRSLLDTACSYGYELVIPPAMEYLTSLLTGTGSDLNLQTFKLVDQLSGRSMGLRAVFAIAAAFFILNPPSHRLRVSHCSSALSFMATPVLKPILKLFCSRSTA